MEATIAPLPRAVMDYTAAFDLAAVCDYLGAFDLVAIAIWCEAREVGRVIRLAQKHGGDIPTSRPAWPGHKGPACCTSSIKNTAVGGLKHMGGRAVHGLRAGDGTAAAGAHQGGGHWQRPGGDRSAGLHRFPIAGLTIRQSQARAVLRKSRSK